MFESYSFSLILLAIISVNRVIIFSLVINTFLVFSKVKLSIGIDIISRSLFLSIDLENENLFKTAITAHEQDSLRLYLISFLR